MFQHLLVLSSVLLQINRELQRLGGELASTKRAVTTDKESKSQQELKLKQLEAKINTLTQRMNEIFVADNTNMLLAMEVKVGKGLATKATKMRFYQKIILDHQQMLADGVRSAALLTELRKKNEHLLHGLALNVIKRSRDYLHHAWNFTCNDKAKLKRLLRGDAFVFYFKHQQLVEHVKSMLAGKESLLALHNDIEKQVAMRIDPSNYQSSAMSFFGMLGGLTIPSFMIPA